MTEIPLNRGRVALVDDDDATSLSAFRWRCDTRGYVSRGVMTAKGPRHLYLHRLLTSAPPGTVVDHIDGNPLNNQRANLRVCSNSENLRNARPWGGRPHKGIYLHEGRWRARIKVNYREMHIGAFDTQQEAMDAYDAAALHHFGLYALTNATLQARKAG